MNSALSALPGWARGMIYICGPAATIVVQLGSSWSLGSLAYQAGLGWPRLLLLPIALDLGAIVAATLWVAGKGRNRVTGRCATLGLVFTSICFNAADSLASSHKLSPSEMLYISVGIAVIFPLSAALMGHIVLLVRETDSAVADARSRERELREQAESDRQAELVKIAAKTVVDRIAQAEAAAEKGVRRDNGQETALVELLPGDTKGEKLQVFIGQQWDAGIDKSAAAFERELYGTDTGYGNKAVRALREKGIVPPSERSSGDRPKLSIARS